MAMVRLNSVVSGIAGKEGGHVYKKDRYGQHVQAFPRLVNKQLSVRQKSQQQWFNQIYHRFFQILPIEYQSFWFRYAGQHPVKNRNGDTHIMQAVNAYLKVNLIQLAAGLPIVDMPPGYEF